MLSEHERAIHYFSRAYEVDPTFYAARVHKGVLLSREFGRHDEALVEFDAVLQVEPENLKALLNRGLALQANGRFQDAMVDLEKYLALGQSDEYWADTQRIVRSLQALIEELEDE